MSLIYIVIIGIWIICYLSLRFLLLLILTYVKKENRFIQAAKPFDFTSSINFFSSLVTCCLSFLVWYIWTNPETDNIVMSNFKFEKCVSALSSNFTPSNPKIDDEFYVYYSYELKNISDDIKEFRVNPQIILDNFNNMGEFKSIFGLKTYIFDNKKQLVLFDDIKLFNSGETYKVYGSIELNGDELKWFIGNISFVPKIKFKLDGGTVNDNNAYLLKEIKQNVDISGLKKIIFKSYNDSNTLKMSNVVKNIRIEKRKKGQRETDALSHEEIIKYLFID